MLFDSSTNQSEFVPNTKISPIITNNTVNKMKKSKKAKLEPSLLSPVLKNYHNKLDEKKKTRIVTE